MYNKCDPEVLSQVQEAYAPQGQTNTLVRFGETWIIGGTTEILSPFLWHSDSRFASHFGASQVSQYKTGKASLSAQGKRRYEACRIVVFLHSCNFRATAVRLYFSTNCHYELPRLRIRSRRASVAKPSLFSTRRQGPAPAVSAEMFTGLNLGQTRKTVQVVLACDPMFAVHSQAKTTKK